MITMIMFTRIYRYLLVTIGSAVGYNRIRFNKTNDTKHDKLQGNVSFFSQYFFHIFKNTFGMQYRNTLIHT